MEKSFERFDFKKRLSSMLKVDFRRMFTMRASKIEYIISKTLIFFVSETIMILAYFIGSLIGGAIAGLNFQLVGFTLTNVIMCLLAKIFLLLVFTAIYLVMSVIGKHKTWLSMVLSLAVSMLLFMMIPSISPLTSTIINVALSLAGGVIFCTGIGAISNAILTKTSLV